MPPTPSLDRPAKPADLRRLAEAGVLDRAALARGLELVDGRPTTASWYAYARRHLLLLGTVLLAVGVVFFVAANWGALHAFVRMGLVAAAMVTATGAAAVLGLHTLSGRAAALLGGLLFGPLLALYGQTYQTGADSYGLFATWSLVMVVYALASRFVGAWIVYLLLVHLAALLWWDQEIGGDVFDLRALPVVGALVAFDALVVILLEGRGRAWQKKLAGRLLPRVATVFALALLTLSGIAAIVDDDGGLRRPLALLLAVAALVAIYQTYSRRIPDAFMLVAGAATASTLVTTAIVRLLFDELKVGEAPGLLLVGLALSAQVWGLARWLLRWRRRFEEA
ncbi:MAG: DUF2157 domain-containing protein [bacterium]|nr:DUF2157 domain-containing protein [bacterium]